MIEDTQKMNAAEYGLVLPELLWESGEINTQYSKISERIEIHALSIENKKQGDVNADKIVIKKHGNAIVTSLVDGVIFGDQKDRQRELDEIAEDVEKLSDLRTMNDVLDLTSTNKGNSKQEERTQIDKPFAWMKITPDSERKKLIVEWVAQSDVAMWAVVSTKFGVSFESVYFEPQSMVQESEHGIFEIPEDSCVFMASDGGIQAMGMSPSVGDLPFDRIEGASPGRHPIFSRTNLIALDKAMIPTEGKLNSGEAIKILEDINHQLHDAIGKFGIGKTMKNLMRSIGLNNSKMVDDASFVVVSGISSFESDFDGLEGDVLSLLSELSMSSEVMDTTINQRIRSEHGNEAILELMEFMIEKGFDGGMVFARVCSLVKYSDLSESLSRYFDEKGLVVFEDVDIFVHPGFLNERGAYICGDIGLAATLKTGLARDMSVDEFTKAMSPRGFMNLNINKSDNFPKGVWTTIQHTTGQHITVPGAYIASRNGVGIIVPTTDSGGAVLLHSPNEHEKKKRNFFMMNSGIHPDTHKVFLAYSNGLQNPHLLS